MALLPQVLLRSFVALLVLFATGGYSQPSWAHNTAGASTLLQNRPNTADSLRLNQPSSDWGSKQTAMERRRRNRAALDAERRGISMSEAIDVRSIPITEAARVAALQRRREMGRTESGVITEGVRAQLKSRDVYAGR